MNKPKEVPLSDSAARLIAKSKVWLADAYLKDIVAFRSGDVNRFGRMVDSKNGLGSEKVWITRIYEFASSDLVVAYCQLEIGEIVAVLEALFESLNLPDPFDVAFGAASLDA